jgi:hypothetical protein
MHLRSLFLFILFALFVLAGCNQPAVSEATSTPAATSTEEAAEPTGAATEGVTATAEPESTETPVSSETPTVEVPTNTAEATATIEPSATAVPPTATAMPTTPPTAAAPATPTNGSAQLLVAIEDEATGADDLYLMGLDGSMTLFASLAELAGSYDYIAEATAVDGVVYLSLVESGGFSFWMVNSGGELQALDFISSAGPNVREIGVWPGAADQPDRIAWATSQLGVVELYSSAADGSGQVVLAGAIQETDFGVWDFWEVLGWSADGQRVYYAAEPAGAGGVWLFGGYSDLWVYDIASNSSTLLKEAFTCLEPLSPDEQWLPDQCGDNLGLTNLVTGEVREVLFPAEVANVGQFGQVRFRPDGSRLAYAAESGVANGSFVNDPDSVQGWVMVADTATGTAEVIATGPARSYFTVEAWLPQDVLVLHGTEMPGYVLSVWTVNADGTGLVKLTDGQFLAWVAGP